MILKKIVVGKLYTNSYLIIDEETKDAAIIDPGFGSDKIISEIDNSNCNLKYIILTHGHFDHAFEADIVKDMYDAKLVMNEKSKEVIEDENHNLAESFLGRKLKLIVSDDDILLKDNDEFNIGNIKLKALFIGGHTIDSTAYYIEDEKVIFTGDTLFYESIGRTDFYGGNENEIIENINNKIISLPEDVKVYPGHGEETTVGNEKKYNEMIKR